MELTYPFTPDELICGLAAKMRSANLEFAGSSTEWTKRLKLSLWELLQTEGTTKNDVLFSNTETDNHEFLLDVVVWDRSDGEGVTLAVESEWQQTLGEIEQDFWKLLVVKASTKLMVFALNKTPRKHTQEAVWESLCNCLKKYRHHQKGERYVFVDYAPAPSRKAWWIEVAEDGRMPAVPERQWIAII